MRTHHPTIKANGLSLLNVTNPESQTLSLPTPYRLQESSLGTPCNVRHSRFTPSHKEPQFSEFSTHEWIHCWAPSLHTEAQRWKDLEMDTTLGHCAGRAKENQPLTQRRPPPPPPPPSADLHATPGDATSSPFKGAGFSSRRLSPQRL